MHAGRLPPQHLQPPVRDRPHDVADEAIRLLGATGLHGHEYAIDAALAVIAGRQAGCVVVFTSDEDDMGKLCGADVLVRGL
ncbi:hypothetical protein ACFYYY_04340 [Streptomyces sp. NPDC001834]|uniref:hypothetical protein n=1 Tax=Streptomyces sp. NPDC001834 TaxID=3364616 RepID=UPI0036C72E35